MTRKSDQPLELLGGHRVVNFIKPDPDGFGSFDLITPHGFATAAFRDKDGARLFYHTLVPTQDRGQGFATAIIGFAIAMTQRQGLHIKATCPFVIAWLAKHPNIPHVAVKSWDV